MKDLKTKKPDKKIGAKRSWSNIIPVNAVLKVEVGVLKMVLVILGIKLQYQTWRHGAR